MPNSKYSDLEMPANFRRYFWDCNFENIDMNQHLIFITERILNLGNREAVQWLKNNVDENIFKRVVLKSKKLNQKTKNYWKLILNV